MIMSSVLRLCCHHSYIFQSFAVRDWNCVFTVLVVFALSLQDSKDAEQYFPLTANHSCWDWVRRRDHKREGEERLKQRETEREK